MDFSHRSEYGRLSEIISLLEYVVMDECLHACIGLRAMTCSGSSRITPPVPSLCLSFYYAIFYYIILYYTILYYTIQSNSILSMERESIHHSVYSENNLIQMKRGLSMIRISTFNSYSTELSNQQNVAMTI